MHGTTTARGHEHMCTCMHGTTTTRGHEHMSMCAHVEHLFPTIAGAIARVVESGCVGGHAVVF